MVYDAATGQVVMFGGSVGGSIGNETWVWDGSNWTQEFALSSPAARTVEIMAYDSTSQTVVLFGGAGIGDNSLNDTWLWDGTNWTQRSPLASPTTPRWNGAMEDDPLQGGALLFGGTGSGGSPNFGDTWLWNGTSWSQAVPSSSPSPRAAVGLAYDSMHRQLVLFGGADNVTVYADTWVWGPSSASLSMGPQAMEGNLTLNPGSTLETGYDFTMPGSHPGANVSFVGARVTFEWRCASGPGSGTLIVPIADQSYTDPQNSSAWYPSGDQQSAHQGSTSVPDVCAGGAVSFAAGGTFSTGITSNDTTGKVNVRWHYSGGGSAGGWSGTKSVVP